MDKLQINLLPKENDCTLPSPSQKKLKQKFADQNPSCGQDLAKHLHALSEAIEFEVSTILGLAS